MKLTLLTIGLIGILLSGYSQTNNILISNSKFAIYRDKVVQDSFFSKASGDTSLVSNYRSTSNYYTSPNLVFKFSINGVDDELNYDAYHYANITPDGQSPVILNVEFGKPSTQLNYGKSTKSLPYNTTVVFRVDMRQVLKSFEEKGYYINSHGVKVYKSNLEGFYIAGNISPLDWQFTNLKGNGGRRLRDDDKDGIYEVKLTFNNHHQSTSELKKWTKTRNTSKYPILGGFMPLLNSLYNMSLEEMRLNIEADSTFRTGKFWSGVWTRDVSYSIMLAMGMLEPEIAKISLMRKVRNKRIIQDTGTGGAWPCSSDRVVWTLAAWEIYEFTGDKEWLKKAYEISATSVIDDQKNIYDSQFGLMRGESSFLDWREQTFAKWMQPADIYSSMNLGTNAAYYQVLNVLGKMAAELKIENTWAINSNSLKENINKNLWLNDKKYFGQYLYGRNYKNVSARSEALGEAFTVLFDIADNKRKAEVLENTPVLDYGIPCIYPQIPNQSSYHNNAIWPFVEAFWVLANAKEKNAAGVEAGMAAILRQSALFLTNKENFVAQDGDQEGTMMNSDRQLWSIAAQLAMVYKVMFGINFYSNQMNFNPIIPESLKGEYTLNGIKYRNGVYNITIKGFGNAISSFKFDGKTQLVFAVEEKVKGNHTIIIELNNKQDLKHINRVENYSSPDMPTAKIENEFLIWDAILGAKMYNIYKNGIAIKSQAETKFKLSDTIKFAEYKVSVIDASGYESFMSEPVTCGKNKILLNAISFNLPSKNDCDGTIGGGYVALTLANKEILKFNVEAPGAGIYHINFRYANGNGPGNGDNKCGVRSLWVNGKFEKTFVFPQRGGGEWSNWGFSNTEKIELKAGKNDLWLQFDPQNDNMNGKVNDFILDQIILEKED